MAEKELTPEQKRAQNVRSTLEAKLLQQVIGGNEVKTNPFLYGQFGLSGGEEVYSESLSGEDADNMRKALYQERQKRREELGIAEEAPYPTNYDLVEKIKMQVSEIYTIARLGELEKAAKDAGAKLDFEVPENLKNYIQRELIQKAFDEKTGKIDLDKNLNATEKDALQMQRVLVQAYERALAFKAASSNYFSDLSQAGKKISEKYNPHPSTAN